MFKTIRCMCGGEVELRREVNDCYRCGRYYARNGSMIGPMVTALAKVIASWL